MQKQSTYDGNENVYEHTYGLELPCASVNILSPIVRGLTNNLQPVNKEYRELLTLGLWLNDSSSTCRCCMVQPEVASATCTIRLADISLRLHPPSPTYSKAEGGDGGIAASHLSIPFRSYYLSIYLSSPPVTDKYISIPESSGFYLFERPLTKLVSEESRRSVNFSSTIVASTCKFNLAHPISPASFLTHHDLDQSAKQTGNLSKSSRKYELRNRFGYKY